MTAVPVSAALEILERLIGFDTTSANSNLELIRYVQTYLSGHGVASRIIANEAQTKANLFATIGPPDGGGIMLSGHTDTVPVTGQHWTRPPYRMTEEAERYYGRGTADMKAFIAVVLAAVPRMQGRKLRAPIHIVLSYDEEIGCVGVHTLLDTIRALPSRPALCIVGEPTSMRVVTKHKGKLAASVTVVGKECHSGSAPLGVNAIYYAARLVNWLEQRAGQRRAHGPFDAQYAIPYTTVHTGIIAGGTALNIVPGRCTFSFEVRHVAADDPHELLRQFQAYANELLIEMRRTDERCAIAVEVTTEYPGLDTDNRDLVELLCSLSGSDAPGSVDFGSEGGLFSRSLGIPTVLCGPGSMAQGHKADEYIELSQIERCEALIGGLIDRLGA